jgi:hypothetical protein
LKRQGGPDISSGKSAAAMRREKKIERRLEAS